MTLTDREKVLILISNAISVYSVYAKSPEIMPKGVSMIDFVLKCAPPDLKKEITIEMIDEVFAYVTKTQSQLS